MVLLSCQDSFKIITFQIFIMLGEVENDIPMWDVKIGSPTNFKSLVNL